uniref:Uncharacterized protein n=1 Tax=Sus scrofa TaxID=9823 RepID=A0A8D1MRS5_PIG
MSTIMAEVLLVLYVKVNTSIFIEIITWLLLDKTDKWPRTKIEVQKISSKFEPSKQNITKKKKKKKKKKITAQEQKQKNNNIVLALTKNKSIFIITFCKTVLRGKFNDIF